LPTPLWDNPEINELMCFRAHHSSTNICFLAACFGAKVDLLSR
jgi:hypothetical protein